MDQQIIDQLEDYTSEVFSRPEIDRLRTLAQAGLAVQPIKDILIADKVALQSRAIRGYYITAEGNLTFAELAKFAAALEALPKPQEPA